MKPRNTIVAAFALATFALPYAQPSRAQSRAALSSGAFPTTPAASGPSSVTGFESVSAPQNLRQRISFTRDSDRGIYTWTVTNNNSVRVDVEVRYLVSSMGEKDSYRFWEGTLRAGETKTVALWTYIGTTVHAPELLSAR